MTRRELVIEALEHRETPVIPHHLDFTQKALEQLIAYTGDPDINQKLRSCLNCMQYWGWPTEMEERPGYFKDEFGAIWNRSGPDKDIGVLVDPQIDNPETTDYTFPSCDKERLRREIEELIGSSGDCFTVAGFGFSMFERSWTLMGMENVLISMISCPDALEALYDRICDYHLELIDIALEYDIDAVYFGDDWGQQHGLIMGASHWRRFIKPRMARFYERVKRAGKYVLQHSCGDIFEIFPDLIEIGLDCYQTFQPEIYDIEKTKKLYGDRLSFWGGVSTQQCLPRTDAEGVRKETVRIMKALRKGGGLIIAPTHALPYDIPPENILAMTDVFLNQSRYLYTPQKGDVAMFKTGGDGDWKVIDALLNDIAVPRFVKVRQIFPHPPPVDVAAEIRAGMRAKNLPLKKGSRIAITVGSRGISNQVLAVKTIGEELRAAGAAPFIVPAMGSHGGATAEGQAAMLREMGFGEEKTGMPIVSSMEVAELGKTKSGLPVLIDRNAYEADGIIIINRIKPHVSFHGPYESGLMKMITIGLGKQRGADIAHNLGFGKMAEHVPELALESMKQAKFLLAFGLLENAFHETSKIAVLLPGEIEAEEPKLLEEARLLCAKLHFDTLDTLIIDEIGKHISGSGYDTNVVGRYHSAWISGGPKINRLVILDISDTSKGNGLGLGNADFSTLRALEKFDFTQTYPNILTATLTGGSKIPTILLSDRQAIQACIKTSNLTDWSSARIVRIKNTLCLNEIEVSENMVPELDGDGRFEILSGPYGLPFDAHGNLF